MAENTHTRKWQKKHTCKMTEWKGTTWKMAENACTGLWQKLLTQKMTEWKMHDMENCRLENS